MALNNRIGRDSRLENDTQSFIIRVWYEAVDDEGHVTVLRGSIDHVGSGKRLYFHDLESITGFIQEYVRMRSNDAGSKWRSWLSRLRREESDDGENNGE